MEKMNPVSIAPVIKKVEFSPSRSVSKNIANAPQKHQSTHPKNYQMFQDAILTNF